MTPSYGAERDVVVKLLNEALATTRRLLEQILAKAEEHAQDMSDLLVPHGGKNE